MLVMSKRELLESLAVTIAVAMLAPSALASSGRIENKFAARSQTLPKYTLRLDDGPYWPLPAGVIETTFLEVNDQRDTETTLNFGAGFGLIENLEVGVHLVKFNSSKLAAPSFYGQFRFLPEKAVELSAFAEVTPRFGDDPSFLLGMPVSFHLGDSVRLDTGPFILFPLETNIDTVFIAPLQVPINVTDQVFLGPEAGLFLPEFKNEIFLAGFFVGYTIPTASGAFGDVGGRFRLPNLDIGFDVFQIMAELSIYFDF